MNRTLRAQAGATRGLLAVGLVAIGAGACGFSEDTGAYGDWGGLDDVADPDLDEDDVSVEALAVSPPVVVGDRLFFALPDRDLLAGLDTVTSAVTTWAVGAAPKRVFAAMGGQLVGTLNVASSSVSLVDPSLGWEGIQSLPLGAGVTELVVADGGEVAVGWRALGESAGTSGSLQEVTVLDFTRMRSWRQTVGFGARSVHFGTSSAWIVTLDGLYEVDLEAGVEGRAPRVDLGALDLASAWVEPSPAGTHLAAADPEGHLALVDLDLAEVRSLDLGQAIDDLTFVAGSSNLVVSLADGRVALVTWDALADPAWRPELRGLSETPLALVPFDADSMLGFDAAGRSDQIFLVDTTTWTIERELSVAGLVRAVTTLGPETLVVWHAATGALWPSGGAFSILDLAVGTSKLVTTSAPPASFTQTADGRYLATLQLGDDSRLVVVDLLTWGVSEYDVGFGPTEVGALPAGSRVYTRAELGGLTIVDCSTGERESLSGYELNALVE